MKYTGIRLGTLTFFYKLRLIKLLHSVFTGEAPAALSCLVNKPFTAYNLRRSNKIVVPHFNSQFLKNSISYRGAILWNAVSTHFTGQLTDFYLKVKKDFYFKEFNPQSVQSLPRHYQDFKCYSIFYLLIIVVDLFRSNHVSSFSYRNLL